MGIWDIYAIWAGFRNHPPYGFMDDIHLPRTARTPTQLTNSHGTDRDIFAMIEPLLQCEAPGHDSVQLVQITPMTMVYGTYNYSYWAL